MESIIYLNFKYFKERSGINHEKYNEWFTK